MSAPRRTRWAPRLAAALLAVVGPAAARAQVVAGRVESARGGAPVENAVVVLLDSARRQLGGALSDSVGGFTLRAPAPGRYWVRADRVGSASAVAGPVSVGAGETARVRLALGDGRRLGAVRVTARERCEVRPGAGTQATALWDEVRSALAGASLALGRDDLPFSLERFERTLDPGDRRLVREDRWINPTTRELFGSAPAEELQRLGWVRSNPARPRGDDDAESESDGMHFFAPDAQVLLSDAFVDSHCLRAVAAPPSRVGQVGLAFEPARRRRPALPDVRGTLWLDTATSELRDLEFEYTDLPRHVSRHRPGGSIAFARLPNGLWYVSRWALRMPVLIRTDATLPLTLESVREVGGRMLLEEDRARVPATLALLTGMVVDSTSDFAPVVGARVSVVGTPYNAFTDAFGRFRLELPDSGTATLALSHPRLTALGVRPRTAAPLVLGRETLLPFAFPSVSTIRRELCGPTEGDSTAVLVGAEWTQAMGATPGVPDLLRPRRGVEIDVKWQQKGGHVGTTVRRTIRADASGHFHACGVAADVAIGLEAPLEPGLRLVPVPTARPDFMTWAVRVRPGGLGVLEWVSTRERIHQRLDVAQPGSSPPPSR